MIYKILLIYTALIFVLMLIFLYDRAAFKESFNSVKESPLSEDAPFENKTILHLEDLREWLLYLLLNPTLLFVYTLMLVLVSVSQIVVLINSLFFFWWYFITLLFYKYSDNYLSFYIPSRYYRHTNRISKTYILLFLYIVNPRFIGFTAVYTVFKTRKHGAIKPDIVLTLKRFLINRLLGYSVLTLNLSRLFTIAVAVLYKEGFFNLYYNLPLSVLQIFKNKNDSFLSISKQLRIYKINNELFFNPGKEWTEAQKIINPTLLTVKSQLPFSKKIVDHPALGGFVSNNVQMCAQATTKPLKGMSVIKIKSLYKGGDGTTYINTNTAQHPHNVQINKNHEIFFKNHNIKNIGDMRAIFAKITLNRLFDDTGIRYENESGDGLIFLENVSVIDGFQPFRRILQNIGSPDLDHRAVKVFTQTAENFDALSFFDQTAVRDIYNETRHSAVDLFEQNIPDKFIIEKLQKHDIIDEFTK